MQQKKPPFKVLSIVFFAIAAVFLCLSAFVGVKYAVRIPTEQNEKDVGEDINVDDTDSLNDVTSSSSFDDFEVLNQSFTEAPEVTTGEGTDETAEGTDETTDDGTDDSNSEGQ